MARQGWQPAPIVVFAAGLGFGVLFVRRQRRLTDPLLDLRLFANRAFSIALIGMLMYSMLSGGTMVFITQFLQLVAGLSPLEAGLGLLPGMAAAIVSFLLSPLLGAPDPARGPVRRRPGRRGGGLADRDVGRHVVRARPGHGRLRRHQLRRRSAGEPGRQPRRRLGPAGEGRSAAGIAQTSNEFGYALGIATLGSIGTFAYRNQIPDGAPDAVRESIAAAQHLPGQAGAELLAIAQRAFTSGLHTVALVSAVLLAALAVVILIGLRDLPPLGAAQPAPERAAEPST